MYQWRKRALFVWKRLTLCFGLLCELFWTACISLCKSDKNGHFSPENASLYVLVYSVNFFERHVSRYVRVTKTDTFRPKTPHSMFRFTLWIFWTTCISVCERDKNGHFSPENASNFFEHHVSWGIFVCIFLYLALLRSRGRPSACLARSAARINRHFGNGFGFNHFLKFNIKLSHECWVFFGNVVCYFVTSWYHIIKFTWNYSFKV